MSRAGQAPPPGCAMSQIIYRANQKPYADLCWLIATTRARKASYRACQKDGKTVALVAADQMAHLAR